MSVCLHYILCRHNIKQLSNLIITFSTTVNILVGCDLPSPYHSTQATKCIFLLEVISYPVQKAKVSWNLISKNKQLLSLIFERLSSKIWIYHVTSICKLPRQIQSATTSITCSRQRAFIYLDTKSESYKEGLTCTVHGTRAAWSAPYEEQQALDTPNPVFPRWWHYSPKVIC